MDFMSKKHILKEPLTVEDVANIRSAFTFYFEHGHSEELKELYKITYDKLIINFKEMG